MAVIVILDLLNESCAAVNSPCDTLMVFDHVSALPNSFDADLFLIKIMPFSSFSLFLPLESSNKLHTCTSTGYFMGRPFIGAVR